MLGNLANDIDDELPKTDLSFSKLGLKMRKRSISSSSGRSERANWPTCSKNSWEGGRKAVQLLFGHAQWWSAAGGPGAEEKGGGVST